MATVTKEFKVNYDFWISRKLASGEFTPEEAEELKVMIRTDLTPGPDQLRESLNPIDDHEARYKIWSDFFSVECGEMRSAAEGINHRIRLSLAEEMASQP